MTMLIRASATMLFACSNRCSGHLYLHERSLIGICLSFAAAASPRSASIFTNQSVEFGFSASAATYCACLSAAVDIQVTSPLTKDFGLIPLAHSAVAAPYSDSMPVEQGGRSGCNVSAAAASAATCCACLLAAIETQSTCTSVGGVWSGATCQLLQQPPCTQAGGTWQPRKRASLEGGMDLFSVGLLPLLLALAKFWSFCYQVLIVLTLYRSGMFVAFGGCD